MSIVVASCGQGETMINELHVVTLKDVYAALVSADSLGTLCK